MYSWKVSQLVDGLVGFVRIKPVIQCFCIYTILFYTILKMIQFCLKCHLWLGSSILLLQAAEEVVIVAGVAVPETPIVFLFTINLSIMLFLDWTSNIISLLKSRNWGGNKACRSERYTERKSMTDWLTHKQNLCYCIFLSTSVNLYPYLSILVFVIVNQILYSSLDPLECHYLGLQSIFIFRDGTI